MTKRTEYSIVLANGNFTVPMSELEYEDVVDQVTGQGATINIAGLAIVPADQFVCILNLDKLADRDPELNAQREMRRKQAEAAMSNNPQTQPRERGGF